MKEETELKSMKFGTVRCFDSQTGDGVIAPHDGGEDIFVGQSVVRAAGLGQLATGQTLGFDLTAAGHEAISLWATWSNR